MKKETYFVIFQNFFESGLMMLWVCVNFVLWRYEDRIEGRKKESRRRLLLSFD